jgi:hypothetical protein
MKTPYWFFLVIAILMYNGLMTSRDKKMFEAYDKICAELPKSHPDCRYSK